MNARRHDAVQLSYDRIADAYVLRIFDELQHKPLDRQLLDRFAASVREFGPACDIGCGPGHVARYLHERDVQVCGIDLSPVMVERARSLTPGVEFQQGDMMSLEASNETLAGITAFYSLIHIHRDEMVETLGELRRVLRPGGLLLLAFHVGDDTKHVDELWGHPVNVDVVYFRPAEMVGFLNDAGYEIEEVIEREPYPDVEYQSQRCYLFARRP